MRLSLVLMENKILFMPLPSLKSPHYWQDKSDSPSYYLINSFSLLSLVLPSIISFNLQISCFATLRSGYLDFLKHNVYILCRSRCYSLYLQCLSLIWFIMSHHTRFSWSLYILNWWLLKLDQVVLSVCKSLVHPKIISCNIYTRKSDLYIQSLCINR